MKRGTHILFHVIRRGISRTPYFVLSSGAGGCNRQRAKLYTNLLLIGKCLGKPGSWLKASALVLLQTIVMYSSLAQPSEWTAKGMGGGGAMFAPSISPHNVNNASLISDMSGVFRTANFGSSWNMLNFKQLAANTANSIQFTNNPNILYYLNGSNVPVKSTDGGTTWQPLPGDTSVVEARKLFADVHNAQRVIVAGANALYFSNDSGNTFTEKYAVQGLYVAGIFFEDWNIFIATKEGLLVSTDGGTTFTIRPIGGIPGTEAMLSFAGAKQGTTRRFFCVTYPRDIVRYEFTPHEAQTYQQVYRLNWGESEWSITSQGIEERTYPIYVAMAHNNVETVYIGGSKGPGENPVIYKSITGGTEWRHSFLATRNQNVETGWLGDGGDHGWGFAGATWGLAVAPNDANYIMFTDLGSVHASANGATTWQQKYVNPASQNAMDTLITKWKFYEGNGLELTSSWCLSWPDTNKIFAAFSDFGGIRSEDGGRSWSQHHRGHADNTMYYTLKHPQTGALYGATSSAHDLYQDGYLIDNKIDKDSGRILRSINNGADWDTIYNAGHPVVWLALDPNKPNRMYASVVNYKDSTTNSMRGGIYVSDNFQEGARSTWVLLAPPPRTEGHPLTIVVLRDGTLVCSYSGRQVQIEENGDKKLKFTRSSGVFVSADEGKTWEDRSDSAMHFWTKDLVIDPHDPSQSTWYAAVHSHWGDSYLVQEKGGLYRTTDRGKKWTLIHTPHQAPRISSCTVNPVDPNQMYVTGTNGLWYSNNIRAEVPTFSQVTSYPFRHPQRVFFNPYNANEIWTTSFGGGLHVGFTPPVTATVGKTGAAETHQTTTLTDRTHLHQNYSNPFRESTIISFSIANAGRTTVKVYNNRGHEVGTLVDKYLTSGTYHYSFKATGLPPGIYFYSLRTQTASITKKMVIIR